MGNVVVVVGLRTHVIRFCIVRLGFLRFFSHICCYARVVSCWGVGEVVVEVGLQTSEVHFYSTSSSACHVGFVVFQIGFYLVCFCVV